jgi:hypothetical protein
MDQRRRLTVGKKLAFSAILFGFALLLLEGTCRLAGFAPDALRAESFFWVSDRHLGFRNLPNATYYNKIMKARPLVTTGDRGDRNGHGWSSEGNSPIIVFVGDSFTFCAEVADDQTGPAEVAKLIEREFDVRVLNAGCRGYNTLQAKRMLQECLDRFPTTAVAVYTFYENDYSDNLNGVPDMAAGLAGRDWLPTTPFVRRGKAGEFVEIDPAPSRTPWGRRFIDGPAQFAGLGNLARISWHYLRSRSAVLDLMLKGLVRIVQPRVTDARHSDARHSSSPDADDALRWLLRQMDRICRERGVVFVVTQATVKSESDVLAEHCRAAGVRYIKIGDHFTRNPDHYRALRADGQYDLHYGVEGTRTYAAALAPSLRGILSELRVAGAWEVGVQEKFSRTSGEWGTDHPLTRPQR